MARAALGLGVREIASTAGVSPDTIARLERGEDIRERTIAAVQVAFEGAGAVFIADGATSVNGGPGVRLRCA